MALWRWEAWYVVVWHGTRDESRARAHLRKDWATLGLHSTFSGPVERRCEQR